jgi:cephalosporin-C deacetylase
MCHIRHATQITAEYPYAEIAAYCRAFKAAYNHYAGERDIKVYPYNGHEGGESVHAMERVARARKALG